MVLIGILTSSVLVAQQNISYSGEVSEEYVQKLIEVARVNYPKGKIYDAKIEGANQNIKGMKLSYLDVLSFSYLFNPRNSLSISPIAQTSYQFGFFASIGALAQKPSQIKRSRSELKAVEYEKQVFDLNLEAEVRQRYYTYVQKKVLLRIMGESLLDLESMLKLCRHRFEKGEETLDNYNKALLAYSNQKTASVMTESEIWITKSALEEMLGQKLENIK